MVLSNSQWLANPGVTYEIDQSIRFNFSDAAYMLRTPRTASNRRTWTWSLWVKRSGLGNPGGPNQVHQLFGVGAGSCLRFTSSDQLRLETPAGNHTFITSQVFRDTSAWYHIVLAFDSTQATDTNRRKLYVNGSQVTDFSSTTFTGLAQNAEWDINSTSQHQIAKSNLADYFGGYLAELNFVDGSALAPTEFGETDAVTGQWVPIEYTGSYGTNGFYIDGATSTFLGKDAKATSAAVSNKASTSSEWGGSTGAYTFATNEIDRSSTVNAIISTDLLSGDFSFDFTMTTSGGSLRVGVIDDQESNTFNGTGDDGGMDSMTNSFYLDKGNNQFRYGGASQGSASGVANGSAVTIERTGSTIKITDDGSDAHTFSQTFSGPVRVVISGGGAAFNLDNVQYTADGASGNDNSFFSSGLAAADQVSDSPTDNFCTLNPLITPATMTFTDGNLALSGYTAVTSAYGTFGMSSGKWYWELVAQTNAMAGVAATPNGSQYPGQAADSYAFDLTNGTKYNNGSSSAFGSGSVSAGDTVGVAFDADNGDLKFYNNSGALIGTAFSGLTSGPYFPVFRNGSAANISVNFGQQTFSHSLPTSHVALSTANLPDPTIADPTAYFQTTLYTGNGAGSASGGQEINQSGNSTFQPDFVWNRVRNLGTETHCLQDVVRGANKRLQANSSAAENTETEGLLSFDSDGFTVGSRDPYNKNTATYVAWQWLADNTTGSSNTDGSITSTVSANTTSGFSIVSYTGTGANATVGHGLGVAPSMVICKQRNASRSWVVYHEGLTSAANVVYLDLTSAQATDATVWNSTDPTSTVFSVGSANGSNSSSNGMIAYCFAEIPGFSRISSFVGNGSNDGPMVYTGFRPAQIVIREITTADSWEMYDSARDPINVTGRTIRADSANAEFNGRAGTRNVDFVSNGFKLRTSNATINESGKTFIFWAFAESPFRYANAR